MFRIAADVKRISGRCAPQNALIVFAFRDLQASAASIAKRFKTSDTHVLDVFDRYVKMERLPLTDIISVDEVYTDMDRDGHGLHCDLDRM